MTLFTLVLHSLATSKPDEFCHLHLHSHALQQILLIGDVLNMLLYMLNIPLYVVFLCAEYTTLEEKSENRVGQANLTPSSWATRSGAQDLQHMGQSTFKQSC